MKKKWLLLLCLGLLGCDKNNGGLPDDGMLPPYSPHYIASYSELPAQSQVQVKSGSFSAYQDVSFGMTTSLRGNIHSVWGLPGVGDESRAARFTSLAEAHGDISQPHKFLYSYFGDCLYEPTESLHVTADRGFDAAHPAGSLLDDLLWVYFISAEEYLASGYGVRPYTLGETTELMDEFHVPEHQPGIFFRESLAEFNRIQRTLIMFQFSFRLNKAPDQAGDFVFTITYRAQNGTVLTGTTDRIHIDAAQ